MKEPVENMHAEESGMKWAALDVLDSLLAKAKEQPGVTRGMMETLVEVGEAAIDPAIEAYLAAPTGKWKVHVRPILAAALKAAVKGQASGPAQESDEDDDEQEEEAAPVPPPEPADLRTNDLFDAVHNGPKPLPAANRLVQKNDARDSQPRGVLTTGPSPSEARQKAVALRNVMIDSIKGADMTRMMETLVSKANAGDMGAIRTVISLVNGLAASKELPAGDTES